MNKRDFLGKAALAGVLPALTSASALAAPSALQGPGLLTISGAVGRSNRDALDPALDQMFVKHGIQFEKAHVFDAAALRRLPTVQIRPTLEYDAKKHTLTGPLLTTVLEEAGVAGDRETQLFLRAVDGYVVPLKLADARSYRMVVATEIDGTPLSLGGLGPQWAVYEADTLAAFKDKPLKERFALCPWGLYSIDVRKG